jgi:hypothetical protein
MEHSPLFLGSLWSAGWWLSHNFARFRVKVKMPLASGFRAVPVTELG